MCGQIIPSVSTQINGEIFARESFWPPASAPCCDSGKLFDKPPTFADVGPVCAEPPRSPNRRKRRTEPNVVENKKRRKNSRRPKSFIFAENTPKTGCGSISEIFSKGLLPYCNRVVGE